MLLSLIAKEVSVLKKKVISTLYVFTEQSYDTSRKTQPGIKFYSTRVSLQLLGVLGESPERTH